jgi:hypothetical protein
VDAIIVMLLFVAGLVVLGVAAARFGVESRPGFGDDRR